MLHSWRSKAQLNQDATARVMLASLVKQTHDWTAPAAEACIESVPGKLHHLTVPDLAAWSRFNKDLSVICSKGSKHFLDSYQEEIGKVQVFQDTLLKVLQGAVDSHCGEVLERFTATLFAEHPSDNLEEACRASAEEALNAIEAFSPEITAAVVLRAASGQLLTDAHSRWASFAIALKAALGWVGCFKADPSKVDFHATEVTSLLAIFAADSLPPLSISSRKKYQDLIQDIATAAKQRFLGMLETVLPFLIKLSMDCSLEQIFVKELVGGEPDASLDAAMHKLEATATTLGKHYVPVLPEELRTFNLEESGSSGEVSVAFITLAVMLLNIAKRLVPLAASRAREHTKESMVKERVPDNLGAGLDYVGSGDEVL